MSGSDSKISIDQIADSFAERLERGERPSIAEYKKRYPDLADRIDAVFPALLLLENIDSRPQDRTPFIDDSIPHIVGDYQIIQEIGRGGMGIVFEARHTTMRRRVALKVLPKSAADRLDGVSRFMTEARSAGQLHHTNIVPVFEVGEIDGLHFYAMQFIHGDNLDRVINDIKRYNSSADLEELDEGAVAPANLSQSVALSMVNGQPAPRQDGDSIAHARHADTIPINAMDTYGKSSKPSNSVSSSGLSDSVFGTSDTSYGPRSGNSYLQRVAAVGVQVADALEHAHRHGVLHRDIKPANLILDTEGTVWITDFGLAKYQDDLTQTGDLIGTLRYMAPERFSGDADCRSDIFSLGLTLYELATLQCAFNETNRAKLMRDVSSRTPVRPTEINKKIPADLETIILKSIDPLPEKRYQSAEKLAADLRLFLADRPINARRPSMTERLWRIGRRNPVATCLSMCIVGLLILLVAGAVWFSADKIATETSARKESQRSLYAARIDQAKMRRFSRQKGQRFETKAAIKDALRLMPEMGFSSEETFAERRMLRNELIASTALPDIESVWRRQSIGQTGQQAKSHWGYSQKTVFDLACSKLAEANSDGRIRIVPLNQDETKAVELPSPGPQSWGMSFSPDGRYLAAVYHKENAVYRDVELKLWDLQDPAKPVWQASGVVGFDFDGDSTKLA